ncbi:MAG: Hsp20/alpha crystallin family protein [Planctomycetota bacterium]|nr:MAG: Hsp20/alpha crystallin family protein [Planctomycetota bacterium]
MANETAIRKQESTLTEAEQLHGGRTYRPNVDILEMEDRLLVRADVPGAKPEDIDVRYERGQLTIHARVTPRQDMEKTKFFYREYGVGDFYRSFQIGEGIDAGKIEAELKDGVLTLHLPKTQEVMPKKITVKTS